MTCARCGAPLSTSDHFCMACGEPVPAATVPPVPPVPPPPPTAAPAPAPPASQTPPVAAPQPPVPASATATGPGLSRGLLAAIGIAAATVLVVGIGAWAVLSQRSEPMTTQGGNAGLAGTWLGGGATTSQPRPSVTESQEPTEEPSSPSISVPPTEEPSSPSISVPPTEPTTPPPPTPAAFVLTPSIAIDTVGRFENYLKEDQPEKARAMTTTTFQKRAAGTDWFEPTNGKFESFEVVKAERVRGGAYQVTVHEVWQGTPQDMLFTVIPVSGKAYVHSASRV